MQGDCLCTAMLPACTIDDPALLSAESSHVTFAKRLWVFWFDPSGLSEVMVSSQAECLPQRRSDCCEVKVCGTGSALVQTILTDGTHVNISEDHYGHGGGSTGCHARLGPRK